MPAVPAIYVDADACPVKDEVMRVAVRHKLIVLFVANQGARPSRDPMIRYVTVPPGPDAADDWIVANLLANDIVVTADILLAERALAAGAHVVGPNGRPHTQSSIGMAVAMRNLKQQLRESGADRGLNPEFSERDRSAFLQVLHETAERALRQQK
ncbi:MAG: YaiI/YqxD family protein [Devosia sp.]